VRYLASVYGAGALWPTDPRARASSEKWMDWESSLGAAYFPAFYQLVRKPPAEPADADSI
jgi:glutathione S-transferase